MALLDRLIDRVERGRVPDPVVRWGIRRLCRGRLRREDPGTPELRRRARDALVRELRQGPIAPRPDKANEQHYEVPAAFFARVLGPRLKYSCCYWPDAATSLQEAEEQSLRITCERAGLADGQDILELGCGWGSLTLWMAERLPAARITAVSNSASQGRFIEAQAAACDLGNVRVIVADMNDFSPPGPVDRIVSVEMFEHMRNYQALLWRIRQWLRPGGTLFVHLFRHRHLAYRFEADGAANWMGRHFFTGGLMPSDNLLPALAGDGLWLAGRWQWDGRQYQRTAEAWLANLDRHRDEIVPILAGTHGAADAARWLVRWRLFFMACAELFGFRRGSEWGVSHYLFERD